MPEKEIEEWVCCCRLGPAQFGGKRKGLFFFLGTSVFTEWFGLWREEKDDDADQ